MEKREIGHKCWCGEKLTSEDLFNGYHIVGPNGRHFTHVAGEDDPSEVYCPPCKEEASK